MGSILKNKAKSYSGLELSTHGSNYAKTNFNLYMDSNFKQVSYRGLDFYPEYYSSSTLHCNGGQYKYGDDGAWQDIDCRNSKGEDHRKSSDYTHGLKITYYFR